MVASLGVILGDGSANGKTSVLHAEVVGSIPIRSIFIFLASRMFYDFIDDFIELLYTLFLLLEDPAVQWGLYLLLSVSALIALFILLFLLFFIVIAEVVNRGLRRFSRF